MGILSTDNINFSTPFDRGRNGIILGEGGGFVLLESERSALKRGAKIYCEIGGIG